VANEFSGHSGNHCCDAVERVKCSRLELCSSHDWKYWILCSSGLRLFAPEQEITKTAHLPIAGLDCFCCESVRRQSCVSEGGMNGAAPSQRFKKRIPNASNPRHLCSKPQRSKSQPITKFTCRYNDRRVQAGDSGKRAGHRQRDQCRTQSEAGGNSR
jgi:hypothetical protein